MGVEFIGQTKESVIVRITQDTLNLIGMQLNTYYSSDRPSPDVIEKRIQKVFETNKEATSIVLRCHRPAGIVEDALKKMKEYLDRSCEVASA